MTTRVFPRAQPLALFAIVASGISFQLGAAVGALIMPTIGFMGVVAIRMAVAAPTLLMVSRPSFAHLTTRQLIQIAVWGTTMAVMSLSLFAAIERIGLGLAVTIEFLGPLAVSLSSSRRPTDVACAVIAAISILVLTGANGTIDTAGIACAFISAACWALAIMCNDVVGRTMPRSSAPALAMCVAGCIAVPLGVATTDPTGIDWRIIVLGLVTAVLASVLPPLLELHAIRRVPRATYATLMALYPAMAALIGFLVLAESLTTTQWAAIIVVCTVSVVSTRRSNHRSSEADSTTS